MTLFWVNAQFWRICFESIFEFSVIHQFVLQLTSVRVKILKKKWFSIMSFIQKVQNLSKWILQVIPSFE
jgi:hypothetical protein